MTLKTVARKRGPVSKLALMGAAAGTAAAMAVTSAPLAGAATQNINQQVLTAGPLVNLLPLLGVNEVGPIPVTSVGGTDITLTLQLKPTAYDTQSLYNTINTLPFSRRGALIGFANVYDRVYSTTGPTAVQYPAVLSSGIGTLNAIKAYRAEINSVNGTTPGGYTPFQPGPNGLPNQTNQALILLRDPLRPNGGIESRFAPLLNVFGVDTSLPNNGRAGLNQNTANTIRLNTATLDLAWAYDPVADFPVTLNPFAIANTLLAGIPTNLLGGASLQGLIQVAADGTVTPTNTTDLGLNVASVLGIVNRLSAGLAGVDTGKAFYATLVPNDLPLVEPLRLPVRLINQVFKTDLKSKLADALQPALTIAVNTAYTDVVTPTDGGTYTRTFDQAADPVTFLSQNPLTRQEWAQVPGDMARALVVGFQDAYPVLRFGKTAPILTVDGNHLAITYPPAPATPPAAAITAPAEGKTTPVEVKATPVQAVAVDSSAAVDKPVAAAPVSRRDRQAVAKVKDSVTPRGAAARAAAK